MTADMARSSRARRWGRACALVCVVSWWGCDRAGEAPKPPAQVSQGQAASPPSSRDEALERKLAEATAREAGPFRTRHLDAQGRPKHTNRLIFESSPYLRQHAHNPVDWFPWGAEAFARAERLGLPILLSVGYATCHWCHVMEEESFEDEEIARELNARFVPIKVDREQRPDVDAVYMEALQRLHGSGGWPMTVVLTPAREPFFAATYLPPKDGARGVSRGFLTVLREVSAGYERDPKAAVSQAKALSARLGKEPGGAPGALKPDAMRAAALEWSKGFDHEFGGFGRRQKFVQPQLQMSLLRYHRRTGDPEALWMVERTLERATRGGLRDFLGGGFHRYSVDPQWRVPHFEKMLYDNALLVLLFLDLWQATNDPRYSALALETLDFLEREMSLPEGGFASALDADSAGADGKLAEGLYYTWTPSELVEVLGAERAEVFATAYGVKEGGEVEGRCALREAAALDELAPTLGLTSEALAELLREDRAKLLAARARRPAPLTDRKAITAWNGLAVRAFARAGFLLGAPRYTARAKRAGEFLWSSHWGERGLARSTLGGVASQERGTLDDHAALGEGFLALLEATGEPAWLERAEALFGALERGYAAPGGGYFLASSQAEGLLFRARPWEEGAEPSGNAMAARGLLRLYAYTGKEEHRARAERLLESFGGALGRAPSAAPGLWEAWDALWEGPREVVVSVPPRGDPGPMLAALARWPDPHRALVVVQEGDDAGRSALERAVPWVADKVAGDKVTAYVCERQVCRRPTTEPSELGKLLEPARSTLEALPPGPPTGEALLDEARARRWDPSARRWRSLP